jgi:hypothetical protein
MYAIIITEREVIIMTSGLIVIGICLVGLLAAGFILLK